MVLFQKDIITERHFVLRCVALFANRWRFLNNPRFCKSLQAIKYMNPTPPELAPVLRYKPIQKLSTTCSLFY